MIREIQPEEFLLALEPLVIGHRRHSGDQAGCGVIHLVRIRQHAQQVGLAAFAFADDLTCPVGDPIDAGQQPAALAQAVGGARADQALQHALVQLARIDAHGQIQQ